MSFLKELFKDYLFPIILTPAIATILTKEIDHLKYFVNEHFFITIIIVSILFAFALDNLIRRYKNRFKLSPSGLYIKNNRFHCPVCYVPIQIGSDSWHQGCLMCPKCYGRWYLPQTEASP